MAFKLLSVTGVLVLLSVLVVLSIVQRAYKALTTPLRHLPGPLLARFSRWWPFGAIGSRNFQTININLHKKYGVSQQLERQGAPSDVSPGPIVRIGPNEYSIDDWEAAQVICRPRDQLIKVNMPTTSTLTSSTKLTLHSHHDTRHGVFPTQNPTS